MGSSASRDEVFISTKIHPRHFGYDETLAAFDTSLREFQADYIDLVLLHYAECWGDLCGGIRPQGTWQDSWRALEALVRSGKVLAIGAGLLCVRHAKRPADSHSVHAAIWLATTETWIRQHACHCAIAIFLCICTTTTVCRVVCSCTL